MISEHCNKYLCFSKDLTLATRLIAFTGIAISIMLSTIMLNDSFVSDFEKCRKVALALGLDWSHVNNRTKTTTAADPNGTLILVILIFYAILFFLTNITLMLAALMESPCLAIPWLTCELLGCLSKLISLIVHLIKDPYNLSDLFIAGSVIYIIVMVWWWLVVYMAQLTWLNKRKLAQEQLSNDGGEAIEISSILFDSPKPYSANDLYGRI